MDAPSPPPVTKNKNSGLAIWSLVLGILGLLFLLLCIGPLFAIPAVICGHIAYGRIKRSAGALEGQGMALAGLITGYLTIGLAVFFIPMMAAIAIPNFVKARDTAQKNQCINNLRQIDGAIQQWALDTKQGDTATVTAADVLPYLKNAVVCPSGGKTFADSYTLSTVQARPTCQKQPNTHKLEETLQ